MLSTLKDRALPRALHVADNCVDTDIPNLHVLADCQYACANGGHFQLRFGRKKIESLLDIRS